MSNRLSLFDHDIFVRKEKWTIGSWLHIIRRAARGLPNIRNDNDRWRFLKVMFYLNDAHTGNKTMRDVETMLYGKQIKLFQWPASWQQRNPIISITAFTLLDNHDHTIACEITDNGIAKFMHKTGVSRSMFFNEKYSERGSVFQGPYEVRLIDSDKYLRWVVAYVMCKNTFEMHPKGLKWTVKNFEEAWEWAIRYPFSSLGDYAGFRNSPILDTTELKKILGDPKEFKELCQNMIMGKKEKMDEEVLEEINGLTFE